MTTTTSIKEAEIRAAVTECVSAWDEDAERWLLESGEDDWCGEPSEKSIAAGKALALVAGYDTDDDRDTYERMNPMQNDGRPSAEARVEDAVRFIIRVREELAAVGELDE